MKSLHGLLVPILMGLVFLPAAVLSCFEPSEPLPAPNLDTRSPDLLQLFSDLNVTIQNVITDGSVPWNTSITSFALEVTSANTSLWQSHYTAPILGDYTGGEPTDVTGDTAFRIASISKVFTVLALLIEQQAGNLNMKDPITKYLPDLLENDIRDGVRWAHISLESLASQLSGVPREYGQEDMADNIVAKQHGIADQVEAGLPPLGFDELPTCGTDHLVSKTCTRNDIIQGSKKRPPVFEPNFKSTYSNIAFILLGFVLEDVTGKNYQDAISASILEPLGMHRTSVKRPKDSMGVIPAVRNDWAYVAGAYDPTGGIYSTANDLSIFLRAILKSELLDRATTNAWFKPHSWSSGLNSAYGMPWEIYRTINLLPDTDRGMTIVTKAGGLYGYSSHAILLPEYDFAIVVLVAGDGQALGWLEQRILSATAVVVENMARKQAKERYAGVYHSSDINSTVDIGIEGSSGLVINSWISNGTDFLLEYVALHTGKRDLSRGRVQILPAGIRRSNGGEVWRASFVPNKRDVIGVIDGCMINDVDNLMYGDRSLQEFGFLSDNNGSVTALELPGLRIMLQRQRRSREPNPNAASRGWYHLQRLFSQGPTTGLDQ